MAKTVVVFHSGYGHTERLAKVVAEGAGAALIAIDQNGDISDEAWQALDEADAIIFGSPTYMGGPSWQFKKFADASSRLARPQVAGQSVRRLYQQRQPERRQAGHVDRAADAGFATWRPVGQPGLLPANTKSAQRTDVNNPGRFGGAAGADPGGCRREMLSGDLATAKLYGQRVAGFAAKLA